MSIIFICSCGKEYCVEESYAGKHVRCNKCDKIISVPYKSEKTDDQLEIIDHPEEEKQGADSVRPAQAAHAFRPQNNAAQKKISTKAIISLACGITSFFCITSIPGIIVGHVALHDIRKDKSIPGKGIAIAGLILSYCGLFYTILLSLFIATIIHEGFEMSGRHRMGMNERQTVWFLEKFIEVNKDFKEQKLGLKLKDPHGGYLHNSDEFEEISRYLKKTKDKDYKPLIESYEYMSFQFIDMPEIRNDASRIYRGHRIYYTTDDGSEDTFKEPSYFIIAWPDTPDKTSRLVFIANEKGDIYFQRAEHDTASAYPPIKEWPGKTELAKNWTLYNEKNAFNFNENIDNDD